MMADRDDDGGDHDGDVVGHADGGDDRVEREDDVEQHDLPDDGAERRRHLRGAVPFFAFELVVNLDGRLPQQEQAAADEDEVAPREAVAERGEERLR